MLVNYSASEMSQISPQRSTSSAGSVADVTVADGTQRSSCDCCVGPVDIITHSHER